MSCPTTLTGIGLSCADAIGGIKRVLIALDSDVTAVTVDSTTDVISAITMASSAKFKEFRFRKQTGSYTSTVANDDAAGTSSVTSEISLQFTKAEATSRLAIQALINANAVAIVEDQLGNFIYFGFDNPVTCTAGTMVSGTAVGDLNGFTLTLQDLSRQLPHFVDSSIIGGLL